MDRSDRYVTRLFTVISPEEMTVDPVFDQEERPNVSNIRDASQMVGLYDCQRGEFASTDAMDPFDGGTEMAAAPAVQESVGDDVAEPAGDVAEPADATEPAGAVDEVKEESGAAGWVWVVGALAIVAALAGAVAQGRARPTH